MKKILKSLMISVMAVALLAGCGMKESLSLKITSSGKTTLTVVSAMDNEMIDAMLSMEESGGEGESKTYTDAERWAYVEKSNSNLPDGAKKYDKDGYKGFEYTTEAKTLDELTGTSSDKKVNVMDALEEGSDAKMFIKEGDVYKSNMMVDLGEDQSQVDQASQYGAMMEVQFSIELPSKPIKHNATKVSSDGKTLTWDLLTAKEIELEFKLDGSGASDDEEEEEPVDAEDEDDEEARAEDKKESKKDKDDKEDSKIWLYVGIGGGALLLIVIIACVAIAASKKKKAAAAPVEPAVMTPNMGQPAEPPVQPIQPQDPNNGPQA